MHRSYELPCYIYISILSFKMPNVKQGSDGYKYVESLMWSRQGRCFRKNLFWQLQ